jgi:hypothetical protein
MVINDGSYYTYLKFPFDKNKFISDIDLVLEQFPNNFRWNKTGQYFMQLNVGPVVQTLKAIMPFTISNIGLHKNRPGWQYPEWFLDRTHSFVIHMLLSDPDPNFDARFVEVGPDDTQLDTAHIPYLRYQFILLNPRRPNYFYNRSPDNTRYSLWIGCEQGSYQSIRSTFAQHNNIGIDS